MRFSSCAATRMENSRRRRSFFPAHIKPKAYSSEFRLRLAGVLLARRVLISEGETETAAYPAAARRLAELDPQNYASLEALGIAVFNARG
jgi:putative ATP-dependent endonuclease of the OLD family